MFEYVPPRAFGVWDAPVTDDAEWIDVPTDRTCMHCQEHFAAGDNGAIFSTGFAAHRECQLRSAVGGIGHLLDHDFYCRDVGPDAGLPYRVSALLTWRHWTRSGPPVTIEELQALRRGLA